MKPLEAEGQSGKHSRDPGSGHSILRRLILCIAILVSVAYAQNAVDLRAVLAKTTADLLQSITALQSSVSALQASLAQLLQAQPRPQRMVREVVQFDPATPATQLTLTTRLSNNPAPNTLLIVMFRSSQTGGDTVDMVPIGGTDRKEVVVTLPLHRPFTADDRLTLVYWTEE